MISFKQQFVLAAATVLLAACGGGGGSGTDSKPALTLGDAPVQASIQTAVSKPVDPFRWEVAPASTAVTVAASQYEADLQVQVYRYTQEAIDNGTMGDLVGSGTVGAAGGKVTLDLTADPEESVLVQVLDGPVKRYYSDSGKSYQIAKVKELGTLSF